MRKIQTSNNYSDWYLSKYEKCPETIDRGFVLWINSVENQVYNTLNLKLLDLPDEMYFVNFENGVSSKNMAEYVIENNSYLLTGNLT